MNALRRLAVVTAAASFTVCSLAPLTIYADNVEYRYQINASSFVDFYDHIPADYLGTDGEFHDTYFELYEPLTGVTSAGFCYYPSGEAYNTGSFPMVWYYCTDYIYNDGTNNALWEVPKIIVHLNLHLSSCSFVRFGWCGYSEGMSGFYGLPYAAVEHYNYIDYFINTTAGSGTINLGATDSLSYPCKLYNNSGSGGVQSIAYTSDADFYITDITYSCSTRDSTGRVWLGLYLPFVSENTVLEERGLPENPEGTPVTTDLTGVITGDLVSNTTGYNANFDININAPDYNSKLDAIQSAINPNYDSSSIDDMHAAIQTGVSEENEVLEQASTVLTSLPDNLQFDPTVTSGAINPLNSFFNENIIGIMVFWVGTIAFISYILFGKWV